MYFETIRTAITADELLDGLAGMFSFDAAKNQRPGKAGAGPNQPKRRSRWLRGMACVSCRLRNDRAGERIACVSS